MTQEKRLEATRARTRRRAARKHAWLAERTRVMQVRVDRLMERIESRDDLIKKLSEQLKSAAADDAAVTAAPVAPEAQSTDVTHAEPTAEA